MDKKTVLVTGSTQGIGLATAKELARLGATVVVTGRDAGRLAAAVDEIEDEIPEAVIASIQADLSSLAGVRKLADAYRERYDRLDVLVNNAGALFHQRGVNADGHERTFALNHLAPFALTHLLLDLLKASAPARVVIVGSVGAHYGKIELEDLMSERRYQAGDAYMQSKLSNLYFARELSARLQGSGVTVNCLHPGIVKTKINHHGKGGGFQSFLARLSTTVMGSTLSKGAETPVFLASDPALDAVSGKYFARRRELAWPKSARDAALQKRIWRATEELTAAVLEAPASTPAGAALPAAEALEVTRPSRPGINAPRV